MPRRHHHHGHKWCYDDECRAYACQQKHENASGLPDYGYQRATSNYQQPIPFAEYYGQTIQNNPNGTEHYYTGYNFTGMPDGIFQHSHTHAAMRPDGTVYYDRNMQGQNLYDKYNK